MAVYDVPSDMENKVGKMADSLLLAPMVAGNQIVDASVAPVKPAIKQAEQFKNEFDKMNEGLRSTITRILFTTRHRNILEAMAADFVDTIPFVGDITEAERLADARRIGDHDAVVAHGMDTIFGEMADIVPVAGEFVDSVLDALLPANTLLYLKRKGLIDWTPPLPPAPKIK